MANPCPTCGAVLPASGVCPQCASVLPPPAPAVPRDSFLGRVVGGRYRLLRRLGQGGMGVVYEAEHLGVGQKVAIKFLHATLSTDPEIARRFRNEARSYAQVLHPHAVQLHDFGQDEDGNLFISMEYLDGVDLKRQLARDRRLAPRDALDVALQLCDVLGAAHAKGIVHRDLKPENVMLMRSLRGWHAKVLDFGLAHLADAGARLTAPGMVCGTPRYMAPEQAEGDDLDLRVDVYALGLVLFEMLTGQHPFESTSVTETLRKQRTAPVPHLSLFAADLRFDGVERVDAAIQRATAKDRTQRFGSMLDFAHAISDGPLGTAELEVEATSARLPAVGPRPQGESLLSSDDDEGATGRTLPSTPKRAPAPLPLVETPPPEAPRSLSPPVPRELPEPVAPLAAPAPAPEAAAPVPEAVSPGAGRTSRSRLPILLLVGALVVAGGVGGGLLVRSQSARRAVLERRAQLADFYRAQREPAPPEACQEQDPSRLASLLVAAASLREPVPEVERRTRGEAALTALQGAGEGPEASYLRGLAQAWASQPAGEALARAKACPGFAAATLQAANLALREKRIEEAERLYLAALEQAPAFARARFNLAILRFQQTRLDDSAALLAQVLQEQPDLADAHFVLGHIHAQKQAAARRLENAALAEAEEAAANASYCRAAAMGHEAAASKCRR